MKKTKPTVLAYYFPNWHVDPRNEEWPGKGWTEWEVLKYARPRFPEHKMPRVPAWGYLDESKPEVMEQKIDAALTHGVDGFIFDFYWYNDGGYRLKCLDQGFLGAKNCEQAKFGIMWCNHDPIAVHPQGKATGQYSLGSGDVTVQTFYEATEHCIKNYFGKPNYLRNSEGKLFFCIYMNGRMTENFGGADGMRIVLQDFRQRVRDAGLGEIELYTIPDYYDDFYENNEAYMEKMRYIGFNAFMSHGRPRGVEYPLEFPHLPYSEIMRCSRERNEINTRLAQEFPYNVHIYQGFDNTARTVPSDVYGLYGGWFTWIVSDNTPELFEKHCRETKEFYDEYATGEYITIHSWNEWTEGACLEPDTEIGYGYLNAIKHVFKDEN